MKQLRAWFAEEDGQGMIEYALILTFVALVVIGGLTYLGPRIAQYFSDIGEELPATTV